MTYVYNSKNKFPHQILIDVPPRAISNSPYLYDDTKTNKELTKWCTDNIGPYMKEWRTATIYCSARHSFYRNEEIVIRERSYYYDGRGPLEKIIKEFSFKDKESAMKFKLMWG